MRRWATTAAVVLVAVACSGGGGDATTEGGPVTTAPPSTTATTPVAAPTTTTEAPGALVVLSTGPKRLGVLPEGFHLDAGLDQLLDRVYDDYVGGLVFSILGEGQGVWHLAAGRQEPTLILDGSERQSFSLLDVVDPLRRPPTVLVRADDRLLLLPVTGGAPEELRIVDLAAAGSGTRFAGASLGADRLLVTWVDGNGCATSDLFDLDGGIVTEAIVTTCEGRAPVLSDDGDLIASVERGASTRMVFRSADDGTELARWQIPDSEGWIHASGGVVVFPTVAGVGIITPNGSIEEIPEVGVVVGASIARSVPVVSDLATLGGLTALSTCSTAGDRPPGPQDGLTEAAAATRAAITAAMAECDLSLLGSLLSPDALADGDPTLAWWDAEAKGFPALVGVRAILELPFATRTTEDGMVFTWPAAAAGGDDVDWDVLATVFNQEDIERWRAGGESYDRLVIEIAEDGDWVRADPTG